MLEKLPETLGRALREQRAGLEKTAFNKVGLRAGMGAIEVRSLAFADHTPLPLRYTADGEGLSPPLQWTGVPSTTVSLALIVEDADAPTPQPLVHAIVVDLPPGDGSLAEGALRSPGHDATEEVQAGRNSYLQAAWLPPDPPPGHGEHRYAFQLFALGPGPAFSAKPGRDELLAAVQQHGLASGWLVGTYTRPDGSQKADHTAGMPGRVA
ncbi:YbhB/YbcL family Raf kinase inhibitor-like protein [Schlegelella sp. S2-27]|uniref:YbhB/YbcL family Raf kinase inhibitor-like protein n=1 Tax=Caldimonas mangrovi TaxID=2944811 RepID=A0ABT0YTM4_9BURK|nr:YbhB/YbcL family Raf kinase inhibitor-like protein [Caldimonas mangrovi]MCM5681198.1 YbhB/YbcL family Raf kinase inhibitor-like protein [Caldimonas mangrovi]